MRHSLLAYVDAALRLDGFVKVSPKQNERLDARAQRVAVDDFDGAPEFSVREQEDRAGLVLVVRCHLARVRALELLAFS